MGDLDQTEGQEDSALRVHMRDARAAHVRLCSGALQPALPIAAPGVTLGRRAATSAVDIELDDNRMSRRHGRIAWTGSDWHYVDLDSRNGGFVEGRAVPPGTRAALLDGHVVRLGDTVMVFRVGEALDDGAADARAFPGTSPAAHDVRRRVRTLSGASGHVLILGETGTGKEHVARALGAQRTGPFVAQNCAELRKDLARSELFGHVRGAFSGATQARAGLVELGDDGTLFLDEI
ncbi:MAG TPA: FHA domain-containing protein, partial [Kofleriaceae bacterium]|nr:FHA domain-containing protein [Kofleriaceae bacterium]